MSNDNNNLDEDRDMSSYNLDEDKKFKKFLRKKRNELSDKTIRNYRGSIQGFCQYHK